MTGVATAGVAVTGYATTSLAITGAHVDEGLRLLTANPAAMTGLGDRAGSLAVGRPADLVAVDAKGCLLASFVDGLRQARP